MKEYTNSQIVSLIDEHIHHKRNRLILKLHFVDGESIERIAENKSVQLTPRQVARIISKESATLSRFLQ